MVRSEHDLQSRDRDSQAPKNWKAPFRMLLQSGTERSVGQLSITNQLRSSHHRNTYNFSPLSPRGDALRGVAFGVLSSMALAQKLDS